MPSCWNASACCDSTPPTLALAPSGSSSDSRAAVTSALAVPRSSPFGSAETVTDRTPSAVRTVTGPSATSTAARLLSGCEPVAVWIGSAATPAWSVGAVAFARYTETVVASIEICPICAGCICCVTCPATPASLRPSSAARPRSTAMRRNSRDCPRSLSTCCRLGSSCSAATTASLACASVS